MTSSLESQYRYFAVAQALPHRRRGRDRPRHSGQAIATTARGEYARPDCGIGADDLRGPQRLPLDAEASGRALSSGRFTHHGAQGAPCGGLGSPRKRRAPCQRQRPERRPRPGMLLQADGSRHDFSCWLTDHTASSTDLRRFAYGIASPRWLISTSYRS